MTNAIKLSRRTLIKSAGVVGAAAASGGLLFPHTANAKLDKKGTQVSGFYRFNLGEFEVTVLSDGSYALPTALIGTNIPRDKVIAYLKSNFLSPVERLSHVNIPLINTGKDLVLVDVGGGPNWQATAGKLADNLEAAGFTVEDVTKVVVTHGHPDHIWGMYDEFEEAPRFPNAEYFIAETEWDFWTTDKAMKALPEEFQGFAIGAKKHLPPIAEKTKRIKPGAEILPGIATISTPGHTIGHMSLAVASKGNNLIVTSDTLTHPFISFEHPGWWPQTDFDQKQAEQSRRKVLDMAATDRSLILAYHLSFPGLGRVAKSGNAYRFVPETWQWEL